MLLLLVSGLLCTLCPLVFLSCEELPVSWPLSCCRHTVSAQSPLLCYQVVCAGTLDTFQIYVWSVKTGRLLDQLSAHEGPVCGLAFSPTQPLLASCSWDHSVRTW